MSRCCPKKNHLFLNWLAANRPRFPFEPIVTDISKLHISGYFAGVTSAIKFHVYRGSHIDIDVWIDGQHRGYLGEFLFWEKRAAEGFYAEWFEPENYSYHPTRADLWIKECFEPFLEWCNEKLAVSRWLALYSDEDGEYAKAKLQDAELPTENMTLQKLIPTKPQTI